MKKIEYTCTEAGRILLPASAPFDGSSVLVKLAAGWVEAWWCPEEIYETQDGPNHEGFCWVCLDDTLQEPLDSASHWSPLPTQGA